MQLSEYQRDILIRTALGEARGQGLEGMADVIQTIFNRTKDRRFPSDPAKAALQDKQYSAWNEGEGGNNPWQFKKSDPIYKKAEQALDAVLGGRPDYTGGALFYHTPKVDPYWAESVNKHGTIERHGHIYYPSHPVPPEGIPNVVVSALDVTPPAPAAPVTASPDLQAFRNSPSQQPDMRAALDVLRSAQMGTPDMSGFDALFAPAQPSAQPRAPISTNDLIFDSGIAETIAGTQALQAGQGDLASALERMLRPQARSASELAAIYADGGPTRPPVVAPRLSSPEQVAAAGAGYPWGAADGPSARPTRPAAPTTPRAIPSMPIGVAQSYAGQERAPVKAPAPPSPVSAPRLAAAQTGSAFTSADGPALSGAKIPSSRQDFDQEIMQAKGETVATIPTVSPPQPATMSDSLAVRRAPGNTVATIPTTRLIPGQSGLVGQDSTRTAILPKIGPTGGPSLNTAPTPATQSLDIAVRRAPGQTIATVPTIKQDGIGAPPTTKVVQSVPVSNAPKTAQTVPAGMPKSSLSRDAVAQQSAGGNTAAAMRWAPKATELAAAPAQANPTGYGSGLVKSDNTRLAAGVYPKAPGGGLDLDTDLGAMPKFADLGTPPPATRLAVTAPQKTAPVPQSRPVAVGTQLAVTPPVLRTVPLPRARPNLVANAPLRIVVSGGNATPNAGGVSLASAPRISQRGAEFLQRVHSGQDSGYTSLGNGSFADASGGIYYDRHIK